MGPRSQSTPRYAPGLLERDRDLARIETALARARAGTGEVLVVEGPAGIGKTRLLASAAAAARAGGVTVLRARGAELEQEFAFGVARQLLEPALSGAEASLDHRSLQGPARRAIAALDLIAESGGARGARVHDSFVDRTNREDAAGIVHGLYSVIGTLSDGQAVLVCVDDAHWCDSPSARFLAYLAARLDDLRVTVLLALRPAEQARSSSGITQLTLAARSDLITLQPLSVAACSELVREGLDAPAEPVFCEACHVASAGNPFLLSALIEQLRHAGVPSTAASAARVGALRSESIARAVLATIARLGPDACELARAVAVLGKAAPRRCVRDLAGLDARSAAAAVDALVGAQVLTYGRSLEFVHPIAHGVIYDSIPPAQRALAHARAARILRRAGADPERVAAQVLVAEPGADSDAVETLLDAAQLARQRGAPEVAAAYFGRALDEPLSPDERASIRLELGRARLRTGDRKGLEDLAAARSECGDARIRAALSLELGRGLMIVDRSREALDLFAHGREELGPSDPTMSSLLRAEEVGASLLDVSTAGRATGALGPDSLALVGESLGERLLLAYGSYLAAVRGASAGEVAAAALRALAHGDLIGEQTIAAFCFASFVVCSTDHSDEALSALDEAISQARERGSKLIFVLASWMRAHAHYRRGDLGAAETDANGALDAGVDDWFSAPVAFLVDVLIEQGKLDIAQGLFATYDLSDGVFPNLLVASFLLDSRGRLRCAQGYWREGLEDLLAVGERLRAWDEANPAMIAWRSSAALAHQALGEEQDARRLSEEEVWLARSFGAPRAIGISLRTQARLHKPPASIELLFEAVDVLETSPARLDLAGALTDLGGALRRGGLRAEAREHLRRGLDLATRCGATALADRARAELVAAGARPRRELLRGVNSLTASERRIAALAADGMSNREIAHALFITIRTVKAHLGHVFQKLDITSRDQLSVVLADDVTDRHQPDVALGPSR